MNSVSMFFVFKIVNLQFSLFSPFVPVRRKAWWKPVRIQLAKRFVASLNMAEIV